MVYGTVCLDRTCRVGRLPRPGEYVEVETEDRSIGGEAWNTAVALAAWGCPAVLAGNRVDSVSALGLPTPAASALEEDGEPLAVCDIYVTPDGERTMFGHGFRDLARRAGPVPSTGPGDWLSTDSNLPLPSQEARAAALGSGARVYAMDEVGPGGLLAQVWQSSTDLVGHRGDLQRNLAWLRDRVAEARQFAILSDAANGFVAGGLAPGGIWMEPRHYSPFPCPRLVDSTGAGDVFRAGMLLGLAEGWALPDCLRFASAAGCLNCERWTASGDVPGRDEVLRHVAASPGVAASY